jgi:N6-L-threonylcarbamoyladenine synthase
MALALDIPIIEVNHMQAHILSNFIDNPDLELPFICFTVSGGHTQLVLVRSPFDMELLGTTIDDAAGEAFDKAAKMLKLDYPGGPLVDKFAKEGDDKKYIFAKPRMENYDFSFSGLKTSILYFLQKQIKVNPNFIEENKNDLCASIQKSIVDTLIDKFDKAIVEFKVKQIAIAGGVSANSRFRQETLDLAAKHNIKANIPSFQYCTDNAGMIAMAAYFKYQKQDFSSQDVEPLVRGYAL